MISRAVVPQSKIVTREIIVESITATGISEDKIYMQYAFSSLDKGCNRERVAKT